MEFIFGRPGFNCSLQHTISSFYKLFVVLDVVVLFLCVFVLWLSLISVGQLCNWNIVGHKAKGRILKRVFQEKKAHQIFRKTNIYYPLISTRTCTYQSVRNVCFRKIWRAFFLLETPDFRSPFCLITDDI